MGGITVNVTYVQMGIEMALNLRFEMRTSEALAEKIDTWRTRQRPVLTRGEAARQLIEKGLEACKAEGQGGNEASA